MTGIAILKGKVVDLEKSFAELQIKETDKILIVGSLAKAVQNFKLKFFKRFSTIKEGDSWYVGPNSCDALVFIPNKNIRVFGLGVYEKHPNGG